MKYFFAAGKLIRNFTEFSKHQNIQNKLNDF